MQNKVFSYIEGQQMLTPGMEVLVGFSGGADSTALLLLLKEYGDKHRIGVRAVHGASWDPGRECRQGSGILCKVLSGERNSSSDLPEGCTGLCIDSSYESGRSGTRSTV